VVSIIQLQLTALAVFLITLTCYTFVIGRGARPGTSETARFSRSKLVTVLIVVVAVASVVYLVYPSIHYVAVVGRYENVVSTSTTTSYVTYPVTVYSTSSVRSCEDRCVKSIETARITSYASSKVLTELLMTVPTYATSSQMELARPYVQEEGGSALVSLAALALVIVCLWQRQR
jgi:hypothetical protein